MSVKGIDSRDIEGMYLGAYNERFESSWASEVSIYNGDSDRGTEEYGIFGATGVMREWIGERKLLSTNLENYEIRNRKYEATMPIKKQDRDRDKTGILELQIRNFAAGAAEKHWEDLIVALINANKQCYDGSNFFATDHVFGQSGAQSNTFTATDLAVLNVLTPAAPTGEEFARALIQVVGKLLMIKNDRGLAKMNGNARKFTVVVNTITQWAALNEAIGSEKLSDGVTNPLLGLLKGGYTFTPKLIPDLTGADNKFRIFRTDGIYKPFILQSEEELVPQFLGEGSDHFFKFDEYLLGVKGRRGAGYGLWEHAAEATFS